MTWADFYLICFLLGFGLSALSLLGSLHLHLPHFDFHHRRGSWRMLPHTHGGTRVKLPWFNFGTVAAFLAWFGGTGYLLARFSTLLVRCRARRRLRSGLVGAAIVFCVPRQGSDAPRRGTEPGGLRHDRRARQPEQQIRRPAPAK